MRFLDIRKVPLLPMAVALMVGIAVAHADLLPIGLWVVMLALAALTGGLLMMTKKDFRPTLTLLLMLTFADEV